MTLYVSDLDGTLLNRQSKLSDNTISKLNRLIREEGLLFSIATARTPATVTLLMERVDTTLPFIVMAGAAFWDNHLQQYQEVRTFDNEVIAQLLRIYEPHHVHPFIYRQHNACIYAHHIPRMTVEEQEFIDFRLQSPLKRLYTSEPLEAENPDGAMLVMSMGKFSDLRTIADEIDRQQVPCTYMCYHDIFDQEKGFLEIYKKGTTKAAAIRHLAQQVNADRIVVFGDNLNDIPMMKSADYSVAVGNAFEEVKQQANEVIGTNEEDAVVKWIIRDMKQQKV